MNLLITIKNSYMENFYPKGWDLERMDACCSHPAEAIFERQDFWHEDFRPAMSDDNTTLVQRWT